jgi:hypothetical protein
MPAETNLVALGERLNADPISSAISTLLFMARLGAPKQTSMSAFLNAPAN